MKGVSFQKPLEIKIETNGEAWRQGEVIAGTVSIINHGSDPLPLEGLGIWMAFGADKKVQAKAEGIFEDREAAKLDLPAQIGGNETWDGQWEIALDQNCLITDKNNSPYLVYGYESQLVDAGNLRLVIEPNLLFEDFAAALKNHWSFVEKQIKSKKDFVEFKLVPPAGKSFAFIDYLLLSFRQRDHEIEAKYEFTVKTVDGELGSSGVKKKKKTFKDTYASTQYLLSNQRLNRDFAEKVLGEILDQVNGPI